MTETAANRKQDKTLDRIRKLLRLGQSENKHEAAQAIARAQRLMDEHKIEIAMLEDSERELDQEEIEYWSDPLDPGTGSRFPRWRVALAWALCRANGCIPFSNRWTFDERGRGGRKGIKLVGRASNVQTVRYFYAMCLHEIERLTTIKGKGNGLTWRNNFRLGCVDGINKAIAQEREQMEESLRVRYSENSSLIKLNNVLVEMQRESALVKQYTVDTMGIRWATGYEDSSYNDSARAQGREAGAGIYQGTNQRSKVGPGGRRLLA